jgi:hypothetical protein
MAHESRRYSRAFGRAVIDALADPRAWMDHSTGL